MYSIIIITLCGRELGQRLKILCKPVGLHSDVEEQRKKSQPVVVHVSEFPSVEEIIEKFCGESVFLQYSSSGPAVLLLLLL